MRKDSRIRELYFNGVQFKDIEALSIYDFHSEHELIESILTLSNLYVTNRQNLKDYSLSPKLVSAYLYFYFTTNVPKLFSLLNLLPLSYIKKMSELPFIDVGSGPGTYTVAWHSYFISSGNKIPSTSLLLEKDPQMRNIAEKVLDFYIPNEEIKIVSDYTLLEKVKNIEDGVLFFGHSANEMELEEIISYVDSVRPQYIIFLEPGTPQVFKQLINLRSILQLKKYAIKFPCYTDGKCPLQNSDKNWCHQYLHLKFQPEIDRLTQLTGLKRQHSTAVFHVYEFSKNCEKSKFQTNCFRIIQGPIESKGMMSWEVCSKEGNILELETLTRSYSKEQISEIKKLVPGNYFEKIEITKELTPKRRRFLIV